MSQWELATTVGVGLGESPVWDAAARCLWFVDVTAPAVHKLDVTSGAVSTGRVDRRLSAVIPRTDGKLAYAASDGIYVGEWADDVGDAGDADVALAAERVVGFDGDASIISNDVGCDPRGRLWVETAASDFAEGASLLYRVDGVRATPVVAGCTLANGLDWSPDGIQLYLVDSRQRTVSTFDYDLEDATVHNRQTWLAVPAELGWADGLAVDADGGVWIAMYAGAAVHHYDPAGRLVEAIALPTSKITSLCFGGPTLTDLYVTSSSAGLSPSERAAAPHAGSVFVVADAGRGKPPTAWQPEPGS